MMALTSVRDGWVVVSSPETEYIPKLYKKNTSYIEVRGSLRSAVVMGWWF